MCVCAACQQCIGQSASVWPSRSGSGGAHSDPEALGALTHTHTSAHKHTRSGARNAAALARLDNLRAEANGEQALQWAAAFRWVEIQRNAVAAAAAAAVAAVAAAAAGALQSDPREALR